MCNCSYLGSPRAAERALPARPRCGYAQVSQPCGGVAHVSTASPRDEVALSSRGVRSRAHPSSARCLGAPHAHPPRAAPTRGPRGGDFEARGASCSPEVAQLAPRGAATGRDVLPRRSGPPGSTPARPFASAFFFQRLDRSGSLVWSSGCMFLHRAERSTSKKLEGETKVELMVLTRTAREKNHV